MRYEHSWSRSAASTIAIVLYPLLAASCSVGPDFERPEGPKTTTYQVPALAPEEQATASQHLDADSDIPAQWWELYHNPALNKLVAESLASNPNLDSAKAALRAAMENVSAQQAAFFPTITAGFNASRQGNSTPLAPTLTSGQLLFNLYQAQVSANWTLDIWGGNRRAVEALRAQADGQRYQLESTYVALTTNVVAAAVQEASLRAQIKATSDIIKAETDSLAILKKQNSLGQIAGADVAAQEAALAQAEQSLPPLKKQLAQERDLLKALTGRIPSEDLEETFELESVVLPENVPLSVPSKLVEHRADVRIAEENLHAASAEVGVAIANMLPNFTIAAGGGTVASGFSQLFTPGGQFWSVAGGVAQPLFDGGALLHKTKAARATFDQAAGQYRSTVIGAFQNVADTLYALQYDSETLKAALVSEHAAADTLAITRRQLELGSVSYLALLNAQQTYEQAVIARIAAQASRLSDTAALFQALGGGWWNKTDTELQKMAQNDEPTR